MGSGEEKILDSRISKPLRQPRTRTYISWGQVAGYFDGDGNVGLEVFKYVIKFRLRFIDTWRPQVESVQSFLLAQGISTSKINVEKQEEKSPAYRIEIAAISSIVKAAKAMLPYSAKKSEDLRIAIEYLEGRITGNQAIERLNQEARSGRRSGIIRIVDLPLNRRDGVREKELQNAARARAAYAVNVPNEIQLEIRKDQDLNKLGSIRLSKKYGYSQSVIRRVLRA